RIVSIDLQTARDSEGVVAVLSPDQLAGLHMPPINPLVPDANAPQRPLLAQGRAESLGQPIALVLATTLRAAQAAADQVFVDYESETAQVDLDPDAHIVCSIRHRSGSSESSTAAHRVHVSHRQSRVIAMSLEPRAAMAQWNTDTGTLTAWLGTQAPSRARTDIARVLGLPLARVRVVAPDVGGAFGAKASVSPEDLVVAFAARSLQATIKWMSSRSEEFLSAAHGRGAHLEGELALDAEGRFLHLQVKLQFPIGAWLPFSAVVPARNAARILPGPYRVGGVDIHAQAGMSNAAAINIYRGAGRPEAALLMERLVEMAARKAGINPVELRLRNLVPADAMPYATPTGEHFDAGDYVQALQRACARFGYDQERQTQTQRRADGELLGIGVAMYVEPCGQGWESARVTLQTAL
ncbi:MAG: xanthine dehydrogenase family protein, partial [Burkholderiaceae bacterium]